MSRSARTWARLAGTVAVVAFLVWRLGAGPFVDGVRALDGRALAAAVVLAGLTTLACAWRWKLVARGLGVDLSFPAAVQAYYRSLFLNVTLPGGIVGDVHRGISHGRDVNDVNRALRAVGWERFAGQVVQALLTVVVLVALPSPVRLAVPLAAAAAVAAIFVVLLVARARPREGRTALARARRAAAGDIRNGLLARRAWPGIALASALVVCGHAVTFLIAARTAGVGAPVSRVLPLALLVLLVAALPSVGGWGPREGATAWAFGAAGIGAAQGVTAAVVYGVMVFIGALPGAAVLLVSRLRSLRTPERGQPRLAEGPAHA